MCALSPRASLFLTLTLPLDVQPCYMPRSEAQGSTPRASVANRLIALQAEMNALRLEVGKFFNGHRSIVQVGQRSKDEIRKCKRLKTLAAKHRRETMPNWATTVKGMSAGLLMQIWKKRQGDWATKLEARGDKKDAAEVRQSVAQARVNPKNSKGLETTEPPLLVLQKELIGQGRQSCEVDMEPAYEALDVEERQLLSVPSFNNSVHKEWVGKDRDKDRQMSKADAKRERGRRDWDEGYTAKYAPTPHNRFLRPALAHGLPSLELQVPKICRGV
jgi:hypothetical protein